jgi:DNA-binding IclR family transcriptional regulator
VSAGASRKIAAPPLKPVSASAARTTAAAVQLLRSSGKCAWLANCQPVQYEPSSWRCAPMPPKSARASATRPHASSASTSSQVSATVTHGWSLTHREPSPGTTNVSQPPFSRSSAAAPRSAPESTG